MGQTVKYINRAILIATIALLMLATGCSRAKVIPDDKLKNIFKETFIVNAYIQNEGYQIKTDSLNVYQPILNKYGYGVKDLAYTMQNFSKRKSMKLSDVVDAAILELEREEKFLSYKVGVLDTVNLRARNMFSQQVYHDSIIVVRRVSDTAKLRVQMEAKEGAYRIQYHYTVDSTDLNKNLKNTFLFKDKQGEKVSLNTNWITAKKRQFYSTEIHTSNKTKTLEILFANYPAKDLKKPNIVIDSLYVTYLPPTEIAVDSLSRKLFGFRLIINGVEYDQITKDSSTLHIYPPWIPETRSGDDHPTGRDSVARK